MRDSLTIRRAKSDEAEIIATMWSEAAGWLLSRGINQWQYPASMEKISRDIERGTAHVVLDDDSCVGTITIDEYADPEFWVPTDFPEDALYAHRVITRPEARGISLGAAMLDWASLQAKKAGKSWLRVDAWKTNTDLGQYYQAQGFEKVRTVDLPHRLSGALYQREAGATAGGGPTLH